MHAETKTKLKPRAEHNHFNQVISNQTKQNGTGPSGGAGSVKTVASCINHRVEEQVKTNKPTTITGSSQQLPLQDS
jgi:hypothetical protein